MSQILRINLSGTFETVANRLRRLHEELIADDADSIVMWGPKGWEKEVGEQVDADFEIEFLGHSNRADATLELRGALEEIDPGGEVVIGGDHVAWVPRSKWKRSSL